MFGWQVGLEVMDNEKAGEEEERMRRTGRCRR